MCYLGTKAIISKVQRLGCVCIISGIRTHSTFNCRDCGKQTKYRMIRIGLFRRKSISSKTDDTWVILQDEMRKNTYSLVKTFNTLSKLQETIELRINLRYTDGCKTKEGTRIGVYRPKK